MTIEIPEFTRSPYSMIVLGSVLLGVAVACLLMKKASVSGKQIFLTSLMSLFCIFNCAIFLTLVTDRALGLSGLGAAFGLVVAVTASVLIFREHEKEVFSSWILVAPLMFSLSKIGCTLAGCCRGFHYDGPFAVIYEGDSFFPVQILDTISFMAVFLISLPLFLKMKDKLTAGTISLALSVIVRVVNDAFRESHEGILISRSQIIALAVGGISIGCIVLLRKITKEGKDYGKQSQ